MPAADWVAGATSAGLPTEYAGFLASLLDGIAQGGGARPNDTVEQVLGRAPNGLAAVLDRELVAASS